MVTARRIILSGCSGGGKSALLAELSRRGHSTAAEPGRRVAQAEVARSGDGVPWTNLTRFMDLTLDMAVADHAAAGPGLTFFDRSVVDTAAAMIRHGHRPADARAALAACRYDTVVFLAPPWPAIYVTDPERRHGLDDAIAEYHDLLRAFPANGYDVRVIPCLTVAERADWIGRELAQG